MRKLTLAIKDDVLVTANRGAHRRAAAERLKHAMREERVEVGLITWTREDLYGRTSLRRT